MGNTSPAYNQRNWHPSAAVVQLFSGCSCVNAAYDSELPDAHHGDVFYRHLVLLYKPFLRHQIMHQTVFSAWHILQHCHLADMAWLDRSWPRLHRASHWPTLFHLSSQPSDVPVHLKVQPLRSDQHPSLPPYRYTVLIVVIAFDTTLSTDDGPVHLIHTAKHV